jgi:hypothetical protein
MVTMTADQIVEQVRLKIDEIGANDSDMVDVEKDDSELDSIIRAVAADAYRLVMLGADVHLLEGVNESTGLTIDAKTLVGEKTLPDDFLRLVSVRLSSWLSAASEVIEEDSAEYRMQSDPLTCATYQCPVAALVINDKGKRALELYKAKEVSDTLRHFVYVQIPSAGTTSYNVPNALKEALTWYAAGLTLVAVRDSNSDKCLEVAKGLMGYSGD